MTQIGEVLVWLTTILLGVLLLVALIYIADAIGMLPSY